MRLFVLVALVFTLGIAPIHAQSILYVDANAPDGGNGTSWDTAYTDLQDALAEARTNAGTVDEIWVADGTYYPVEAGSDPLISFEMIDGVSLYGGFVGTETALTERDLETHPFSTLSGEAARPNHVVKAEHVAATLDGFKITGGWPRAESGGGLHITGSTLTLRNLLITQNGSESTRQGGGLYMEMSTATIEQVQFIDNEASSRVDFRAAGGGAFILSSNVVFRNVVFEQNRNRYLTHAGGALFVQDSQVDIFASLFLNNSIGTNELFNAPGGAIFSKNCILRINSTRFIGNSSRAGYDAYGGALAHEVDTEIASSIILNSTFLGNRASGDGGLGGAIYHKSTNAANPFLIVNSIFYDNYTGGYYSGVGGALAAYGRRTFLINSALVGNTGSSQILEPSAAAAGDITLQNSIVWANENQPFLALAQDTMAVYHSIVENGYAGEKVIDADPLFVRMPSPGADEHWGTDDDDLGDLHLQAGSPAIDAGRTAWLPPDTFDLNENGDITEQLPVDYEGAPRVQGLTVDIGPYESPFAPLGVPTGDETLVRYDAYPNPTHSFITLDLVLSKPTVATFTLYDVLGHRLRILREVALEPGLATIHLTDLNVAAGIYFVVIESEAMREVVPVTIVP